MKKLLVILQWCLACTAVSITTTSKCPLTFDFDRKLNKCIKIQDGIRYYDKYPNCQRSNDGPGQVWVDAFQLYEHGPFALYNGTKLDLDNLLTPSSGECVVKEHEYSLVKCDEKHSYKCVVEPYDSGGFRREFCKKDFYYVPYPFRACVSKVIQDGDDESEPHWSREDMNKICEDMGGFVANKEYMHASNEFLRGKIKHLKLTFIGLDMIKDIINNKNESVNHDSNNVTSYNGRILSKQVMCAHYVDYRINLHHESEELVVDCNFDDCTLDDIVCFTDAETYVPTPVSFEEKSPKKLKLNFLGNGYYWCVSDDDKYNSSDRILWIRDDSTLANTALLWYRNEEVELAEKEVSLVKKKIYRDRTLYEIKNVAYLTGMTFEDVKIWDVLRERFPNAIKIANPVYCKPPNNICLDKNCGSYECQMDINNGAKFINIEDSSENDSDEGNNENQLDRLISESELEEKVDFMNDLMKAGAKPMDKTDIMENIDSIANTMSLGRKSKVNYFKENLAASVMDVNPGIVAIKVNSVQSRKQVDFITQDSLDVIKRNASDVFAFVEMNEMIRDRLIQRVTVLVIDDKTSYIDDKHDVMLNSPIIHVSMPDQDDLKHYVDISFRPINQPVGSQKAVCAYWDSDHKSWSTDCCEAVTKDAVTGFQKCRCYRLSNFAQLLVNNDALKNADLYGLEVITYIGLTLSCIGLLAIGMTGVLFREWRRDFGNKIWLNLSASILMMILAFVLNSTAVENPRKRPSLCLWLGVLMHYSILSTFFWMLVSAVLSYRKLVTVFDSGISHALFKASVFSWIGPGVIIGLLLLIDKKSYVRKTECSQSSPQNYCYPSGAGFWVAVFVPIMILIFLNAILYIKILHNLFYGAVVDSHGGVDKFKQRVKVSILLFFLFGMTWFFGLLSKYVVMAYLFCIFATLQGFVMFIFFIIINRSARRLWSFKKTEYNVHRTSNESASRPPETEETEENTNMIRERSAYVQRNSSMINH